MLYVFNYFIFCFVLYFFRTTRMNMYEMISLTILCVIYVFLPSTPFHIENILIFHIFYFLLSIIILRNLYKSLLVSVMYLISSITAWLIIFTPSIFAFEELILNASIKNIVYVLISNIIFVLLLLTMSKLINDDKNFHQGILVTTNLSTLGLIIFYFLLKDTGFISSYNLPDGIFFLNVFVIIIMFYFMQNLAVKFYYGILQTNQKLNEELSEKTIEINKLIKQDNYGLIELIKLYSANQNAEEIIILTNEYLVLNNYSTSLSKLEGPESTQFRSLLNNRIKDNLDILFDIQLDYVGIGEGFIKENFFLEMVGIIIDNAIEAAKRSDEKTVKIVISEHSIKILNSYFDEDLDSMQSDSSKKGLANRINGLKLLKHISSKSNISIIRTVDDQVCFEMVVEQC